MGPGWASLDPCGASVCSGSCVVKTHSCLPMNVPMEHHHLAMVRFVSLGMLITNAAAMVDNHIQNEIRKVIERGMECTRIPGLSTAIVKDGKVMLSAGYGVKDLDTQAAVTPDTLFMTASLTKAFTSTLLANVLAADPSKKLSTNVYKTLTGGFKFNNTLRSTYATLEDLLAHRTGIPRNNFVRLAEDYSVHSFARKIRYLPSKGKFRDSFYYNDLLYGLTAYITEQLQGGRPWKEQIRETIFTPLGMKHSTFVDDVDFDTDDVATPYVRENNCTVEASSDFVKHWGKNLGSGCIMSSANDMAKWMLMLLNNGKDEQGACVVRDGVIESTFTPHNVLLPSSYAADYRKPVTPFSFSADSYALGWKLGYYKGYRMVYHSGSSFGYRAFLTLLPEMNVGIVTLMTGIDDKYRFRTSLHMYLMDRALGHGPWINSSTICSFPEPWKSASSKAKRSLNKKQQSLEDEGQSLTEQSKPRKHHTARAVVSIPLIQYVGSFHNPAYGTLRVSYNETTQCLVLQFGIGLWCLESTGENYFEGHWLKVPPTIYMDFKFKSRGSDVYGVEGIDFERAKPPMFYR